MLQWQQTDATVNGLLEWKHTLIEELLEAVFSTRSAPRLYTRNQNGTAVETLSEFAGSQ
jgi:hypothetical protein